MTTSSDGFGIHPNAETWHIRFDARDTKGPMLLLDQDIEWLVGPATTPLAYGYERWLMFLGGVDPMCPDDFVPAVRSGALWEVTMTLTDGAGGTVTFGPVNSLEEV